MKIRKAKSRDMDQILAVCEDSMEYHAKFDDCFWTTKDLVKNWRQKWRKYQAGVIRSKKKYSLVAEENGTIIGYINFQFKKRAPILRQNKYLYIDDLAVSKKYRRKGAGTKLMKNVLNLARKKGAFAADLNVRTANSPAKNFYSKLGFKETMVEMVKKL
jgi:ribosomal protein S18 acetylase RimI-like enzyme